MDLADLFANATPEQQRMIRLERIFMPDIRRRRDAFFKRYDNPRFVHYTRAEAAVEIIKKKRLWLRNANAMVDFREVEHGFELLMKWFHASDNRIRFLASLDAIHPGAAKETIGRFDEMWTRADFGVRGHTYIASVSEHDPSEDNHGRLSMWRAFGTDAAARVALVFKITPLSGALQFLQCIFSPVAYLDEEHVYRIIEEVIGNIAIEQEYLRTIPYQEFMDLIYFMLVVATVCVKHKGFEEEHEWRIVYFPNFHSPPTPPLIEQEIVTIGGVPQPIYKFPLDASVAPEIASLDVATMFDRLIIGPTRFPFVMYEAFKKTLEEAGIADAGSRVIASTIPIRS